MREQLMSWKPRDRHHTSPGSLGRGHATDAQYREPMAGAFPSLRARDLEGRTRDLPGALDGDPSVVLVAFERRQQAAVDSWLPWLAELRGRRPNVEVYELPTISRRWRPARGLIDGGMRSAIPDPGTRRRTLTVYTDVGSVLRALALEGTGTIAVVAVAPGGAIVWQGLGEFDPEKAAGLERALADQTAQRGRGAEQ
jgi:hypothetical protein